MNFFEHQEKARKRTRWLVFAFVLAVIAIIVAVDLALVAAFGLGAGGSLAADPSYWDALLSNYPLLAGGAVVTLAVIGFSSLYRIASLSGGGGVVARGLGGVSVDADTRDPLRRRLRNVVEEMALASGVPVPEIYVLEEEDGINAFAAGYAPSDAAVAVTRGALERLSRGELQGVIAHEFSHVLNGDMRLNIRLMGALFGILVLALAGRRVLTSVRFSSSGKKGSGGGVALVALALMVVGYVGLFFGRWIKAAVSRQREYLADASAVQFTRHPEGLAGALKKIAVHQRGTLMNADTEEVAHMLFGQGFSSRFFATHPPLLDRIRRIEPAFDPAELEKLAAEKAPPRPIQTESSAAEGEPAAARSATSGAGFDIERLIADIGRPGWEQVLAAAALAAALPSDLKAAARSAEWAPEALLRVLLDDDPKIRDRQLLAIARHLGGDSETQVRFLLGSAPRIAQDQRLPLLEVAFPALKRRPQAYLTRFVETLDEVMRADGRVDVFEYLLAKVVGIHLRDAANPPHAAATGRLALKDAARQVAVLLGVLATHGHADVEGAEKAYRRGVKAAGIEDAPDYQLPNEWHKLLDDALDVLDRLRPADKERLVRALLETVLADESVAMAELELLRALCAALHVPLPPLMPGASAT